MPASSASSWQVSEPTTQWPSPKIESTSEETSISAFLPSGAGSHEDRRRRLAAGQHGQLGQVVAHLDSASPSTWRLRRVGTVTTRTSIASECVLTSAADPVEAAGARIRSAPLRGSTGDSKDSSTGASPSLVTSTLRDPFAVPPRTAARRGLEAWDASGGGGSRAARRRFGDDQVSEPGPGGGRGGGCAGFGFFADSRTDSARSAARRSRPSRIATSGSRWRPAGRSRGRGGSPGP